MTDKKKRDGAIDAFAAAMKARMDWAEANGRTGWDDEMYYPSSACLTAMHEDIHDLMHGKAKVLDIANRCMMLWFRQQKPAPIPIRVRDAHGTYTARCQGKTASCTGGEEGAARAVACKVMEGKGAFSLKGSGASWRIIPEAGQ